MSDLFKGGRCSRSQGSHPGHQANAKPSETSMNQAESSQISPGQPPRTPGLRRISSEEASNKPRQQAYVGSLLRMLMRLIPSGFLSPDDYASPRRAARQPNNPPDSQTDSQTSSQDSQTDSQPAMVNQPASQPDTQPCSHTPSQTPRHLASNWSLKSWPSGSGGTSVLAGDDGSRSREGVIPTT